MSVTFVQAANGLTVPLGPLQHYTSQNTFADFSSSSFPIFALGSQVSESELQQIARIINKQARTELGFEETELAEIGYPAAVPKLWQLCEKSALSAVRWYLLAFSSAKNPHWYPLGFLGIVSCDWKETGVVLVFYDARPQHAQDKPVDVKAFVVNPEEIGSTINSLRQGDDDYENVKRGSMMIV